MKSRRQDTRSESDDKTKDSLQKLRGENRQLKKRISQLQKALNKANSLNCLQDWDEEEPILPLKKKEISDSESKCPKCRADITLISAGIFDIKVCPECGWKQAKKLEKK